MNKETKKLYEALSAKFPDEAMMPDNSRGFTLTSIKAQYVRERLNEVMGVDGWESDTEVVDKTKVGVAVKLVMTLHFPDRSVKHSAFGGCDIKDKSQTYGDRFKSADTDALSKAASQFGVGNDVFKGLVKPPVKGNRGGKKTTKRKSSTNNDFEDL